MVIQHLTMNEFRAGLEKTQTVIIPFGSTEEHGSHLPLDTDTMQAVSAARGVARKRAVFIAPPVHYGVCRSTREHPGTVSISTETLKALTLDIVTALFRQGLRNFILLSGHAGGTHMAALTDAGEAILDRFDDARVAVATEYLLAAESGRHLIETPGDAHAGEIETSRILHSHPQLVRGRAPLEFPDFPKGILVRDKRRYWPGGVWGDPGKASAEKGEAIEELVIDRLNDLVERLENWSED